MSDFILGEKKKENCLLVFCWLYMCVRLLLVEIFLNECLSPRLNQFYFMSFAEKTMHTVKRLLQIFEVLR